MAVAVGGEGEVGLVVRVVQSRGGVVGWLSVVRDGWLGMVGDGWLSVVGDSWGVVDGLDGDMGGFLVDDSVETVVVISGVFDGAAGAIRIHEGVAAVDDVSVAALVLALDITGMRVMHIVGVLVLGMRVVFSVDDLGVHGKWCQVVAVVGRWQDSGVGHRHQEGREYDEL